MEPERGDVAVPYSWIRELGVQSLTDPSRGDEWFVRLGECASSKGGQVTGHLRDATTGPFIEVRGQASRREASDTRLLIVHLDQSLALFAGGRDEAPDEDVIAFWLDAAKCAGTRLGLEGEPVRWSALVGPPIPRVAGFETTLADTVRIGPFALTPESRPLRESWPSRPPSINSRTLASTWFIGVEGNSKGYNWQVAGKAAALDLQKLSSLLSVTGAGPTVVREAPAPLDWGRRTVPNTNPWEPQDVSGDAPAPRAWTPPTWLGDAWNRLESTPWLAHALAAHHEGLVARYDHPSLALIAFIAAIEAISNRLWIEHRCETCGARLQISARFRATLRTVLSQDNADLLGRAYSPRSKTVHEGHLHGSEAAAGVYSIGALSMDSGMTFEWRTVFRMGEASESLLLRALQGQVPPARQELPDR